MTGQQARDDERECAEKGCTGFPDATWDRCAKHQDDLESRVAERPVPTTAMIRRFYARAPIAFREDGSVAREATPESIAFCERQFDRWLEAHNAEMGASARKHPEPEITEAPDLSDPAVVYDLVNEHVTLPGVVEHARRQAEWCCEKGCGTGACESCPCCAAGWCVSGIDGIPDESEGFDQWLEVAAEHNPLAARLQAALRVPVGEGKQAEADSFAPGECTGASECDAPIHVHGCYRPHRADQCDAPEEYGHIPPAGEGEQ